MSGIAYHRNRNITGPEREQTSAWSRMAREPEMDSEIPTSEGKQMTAGAGCLAGAPSHELVDWHAVDWRKAHAEVRRLQVRIAKATKDGRWSKVKALQHMLTHSRSAKLLAVRRVTENRGSRTPGVDGEVWKSPEGKSRAVEKLTTHGYRPRPLRRVLIPKSNGKTRPLGIPTMYDRAMQALFKLALEPVAETTADPNSYGFRPGRSTTDAIVRCHQALTRKESAEWILEGDIRGCFDHIDHDWLVRNVPMNRRVLRGWLEAGYIDKNVFNRTEAGTPQGGIISPILANMALDGLEAMLNKKFLRGTRAGQWYNPKVNFVRYADDFVITGASQEMLENEVRPMVEAFLAARGLELSQEKTVVTHIDEGFDFLGWHVRRYGANKRARGKILIKPSKKNVDTFLAKIREIIKRGKHWTQADMVNVLNPRIRGWANYHKTQVAKATFQSVDHEIWQALYLWARRRHRNKGLTWVHRRYFHEEHGRNHLFGVVEKDKSGNKRLRTLFRAATVKITRHVKIRAEANPFDPEWEDYFHDRAQKLIVGEWLTLGRKAHLKLWQRQNGKCPVCEQRIGPDDLCIVDKHHLNRRKDGGSDELVNLALLHRNCHKQHHSLESSESKPGAKGKRARQQMRKRLLTALARGEDPKEIGDAELEEHESPSLTEA